MKISISLKWYDGWVGFYYDRKNTVLYICFPIPFIVWKFEFKPKINESDSENWQILKVVRHEYIDYGYRIERGQDEEIL